MGSTVSAIIRIRNFTNSDVTSVSVYDVDSFRFGTSRPDKIFNGTSIPSYGVLERTIDFSAFSSNCPFTMKMVFGNGLEDVFRMNYKCVFDNGEDNFRHLTRSHLVQFKKTGPRVLEVIIENTEMQKENQKAEQLIIQGCKLMNVGRYGEASVRFMEASQKANESKTIMAIQRHSGKLKELKELVDVDKKAKILNSEGLELMRNVKYGEAMQKFKEGLELTRNVDTITLIEDNLRIAKEAKLNQDAKKLNQEGLHLRKDNQNEAAVRKFDEALRLTTDCDLTNSIKTNKSETLYREGKEILTEAWFLEITSMDEAIYKFSKAKFLFQEANSVKPHSDYNDNIVLIDCKIEGNKCFNTALQLENEAKTVQSQIAKNKFEEARKCYKEAQTKFEEGLNRGDVNFQRSLDLTHKALHAIERILDEF